MCSYSYIPHTSDAYKSIGDTRESNSFGLVLTSKLIRLLKANSWLAAFSTCSDSALTPGSKLPFLLISYQDSRMNPLYLVAHHRNTKAGFVAIFCFRKCRFLFSLCLHEVPTQWNTSVAYSIGSEALLEAW